MHRKSEKKKKGAISPLFYYKLIMINLESINGFLAETLEGTDIFVVEVTIKPGNRIFIYLDSLNKIDIKDCVKITRKINANFDREVENYGLEVSSAGLTSSFKVPQQYLKNIGKKVKLKTKDGLVIRGLLADFKDETVKIEEQTKVKGKITNTEHSIDIKNILEIKVDIIFFNSKEL